VPSRLEDYKYNCLWNDWVPPTESSRRFEAANAAIAMQSAQTRVHVHLCAVADINEPNPTKQIVWATDQDKHGMPTLTLRWGSNVLAKMAVASFYASFLDQDVVVLKGQQFDQTETFYLMFETRKSLQTFAYMIKWDLPSDAATAALCNLL